MSALHREGDKPQLNQPILRFLLPLVGLTRCARGRHAASRYMDQSFFVRFCVAVIVFASGNSFASARVVCPSRARRPSAFVTPSPLLQRRPLLVMNLRFHCVSHRPPLPRVAPLSLSAPAAGSLFALPFVRVSRKRRVTLRPPTGRPAGRAPVRVRETGTFFSSLLLSSFCFFLLPGGFSSRHVVLRPGSPLAGEREGGAFCFSAAAVRAVSGLFPLTPSLLAVVFDEGRRGALRRCALSGSTTASWLVLGTVEGEENSS